MLELVKVLRFLLRFSRRIPFARGMFAAILATGILSGIANAGLIALINAKLSRPGAGTTSLAWGFLGLCLLLPACRFLSEILLVRLTQKVVLDVRMHLCRGILSVPLRQLEGIGAARVLAALTDDVGSITGALVSIPVFFMNLTMVIGGLAYLGWLSWWVLLAVLAAMVVGIASYQYPIIKAAHYFRRTRQHWDELFKHLRSLTEGIKELKLHRERRESFVLRGLETASRNLQREGFIGSAISAAGQSWGQILFFATIGVLLFILPTVQPVSPVALTGYALTLLYLTTPMQVILNTFPGLSRAGVAVDTVESLGLSFAQNATEQINGSGVISKTWKTLDLSGVIHSYPHEASVETFVLGPLDLSIRSGELVFIVGGNGSGKTTLSKVLAGLYAPESGELSLDGKPITDQSRDDFRQLFSVVFTDFYLFDTLFGLEDPELESRAQWYLHALLLDNKVQVREGTFSTLALSQGQRKRLALLTAYLEDRPIYLFDEWAADQDPQFKEIFYHRLLPELRAKNKTVLVITHDDRYFEVADRVIKLDYGKVVYDGPPEGRTAAALPQVREASLG
jgi:putative pyoverdin transport system ATP-binding/permease protein